MKKPRKFLEDCSDCDDERKRIKHLWVWVWPSGELLSQNLGIPAAFYTKAEALRFKFNRGHKTPHLLKFRESTI